MKNLARTSFPFWL